MPERLTVDSGAGMPQPLTVGSATWQPIPVAVSGRVVTSMHGPSIATVAITEDARVAITADAGGSVRLWPSLDGKREPVVVEMRPPATLALAQDSDALIAVGLDEAGQLELVRLTTKGEALKRLTLDTARPLLSIHATAVGFVALRDDRAIVAVDFHGNASQLLVADPGEHVISITARSGRALAMVERDGKVRGRWVEQLALRWGAYTPVLALAGDHVVLSPDNKRVAGLLPGGKTLAIVDLESGRVLARPMTATGNFDRPQAGGFVSNWTLAVGRPSNELTWVHWQDGSVDTTDLEGDIEMTNALAAGNGRVIAGAGTAIMIARPDEKPQFVGYRMGGPVSVRWFGDYYLATDGTSVVELDRRFRTRLVYDLPKYDSNEYWHSIHLLDAKHVVGMTYVQGRSYSPFLVDLAAGDALHLDCTPHAFEPATSILACSGKAGLELVEYDGTTGKLSGPLHLAEITSVTGSPAIKLLDPKLARGHVAAVVNDENYDGVAKLSRIRRTEATTFEIAEQADVKLRGLDDFDSVMRVLERRFPPTARDPKGSLTAVLRDSRITLRDAQGNERWTIPAPGASALLWTPAGELLAYGAGLARLDVATGAILDRQCGWRFGLWEARPFGFGAVTMCEAP